MNPRPLACEASDLPLIYEPFVKEFCVLGYLIRFFNVANVFLEVVKKAFKLLFNVPDEFLSVVHFGGLFFHRLLESD